MFNIGDTVMHPGMGVCKIENIKSETFAHTKQRDFYILKPLYENSNTTVYVPVDSTKMILKKLITEQDIQGLIKSLKNDTEKLWIDNDLQRKELFSAIIKEGNREKLIKLIKELHEHKEQRQQNGKRLHISDEKFLLEAEKLLHQELAYTMQINPDEVVDFIMNSLNADA